MQERNRNHMTSHDFYSWSLEWEIYSDDDFNIKMDRRFIGNKFSETTTEIFSTKLFPCIWYYGKTILLISSWQCVHTPQTLHYC